MSITELDGTIQDITLMLLFLTCAASSLLAMACLALIRASSLRAALSTLPNNKSRPWEHWPARCTHPGVGPWPLSETTNTLSWNMTAEYIRWTQFKREYGKQLNSHVLVQTHYLARRSATWSVICPRALVVASMSFLSFPAHSSPTLPASSSITHKATSPGSPENRKVPQQKIVYNT